MNKFGLFLFLLLFSYNSFSQEIVNNYYYIINGKSEKDKPYFGMEFEFKTTRKYLNPKEFKESLLFSGNSKEFLYYKIVGNVWYLKYKCKWNLFFDFNNKQGGKIHEVRDDYKITLEKEIILRGRMIYKIKFQPIGFVLNHNPSYYFDPEEGVVIIQSSGIFLIRKDYFSKELTENEINLL